MSTTQNMPLTNRKLRRGSGQGGHLQITEHSWGVSPRKRTGARQQSLVKADSYNPCPCRPGHRAGLHFLALCSQWGHDISSGQ